MAVVHTRSYFTSASSELTCIYTRKMFLFVKTDKNRLKSVKIAEMGKKYVLQRDIEPFFAA